METLLDQFDENVFKSTEDNKTSREVDHICKKDQEAQTQVEAAEMSIAKEIRRCITEVLGPHLSPAAHQPPEGTREQLSPLRRMN